MKSVETESIRRMLRDAGLRSTGPRVEVLSHLLQARTPLSHGEICVALESTGYDRATLYRNLVDLTEKGLLIRSDRGDRVWRFEPRVDGKTHGQEHAHFACVSCGEIACLPGTEIRIEADAQAPKALVERAVEVQLRGRCDACA